MNLSTTSIITKGLNGSNAYNIVTSFFNLSYEVANIPVFVTVHEGGGGGSQVGNATEISVNFSSKMFNTLENKDYIETIVMFDGNKKIIQHYLNSNKISEFSLITHDVDFLKRIYVTDVENDEKTISSQVTLH
jgi:hypothetical protein